MSSLFHLRWRSTSPGGRDSPSQRLLRPLPICCSPGHLCTSACGMTAELLSQPLSPHVLSTSSSALLSPQGPLHPAQPSPLPPLPPGRCTPDTWQSPHLVTQLLPLPSRAVGPCRRVCVWGGASASLHPPWHLGSALLRLRVYETSVNLLTDERR